MKKLTATITKNKAIPTKKQNVFKSHEVEPKNELSRKIKSGMSSQESNIINDNENDVL